MTVWKIAGHKIPCTKCLGMGGGGEHAHPCEGSQRETLLSARTVHLIVTMLFFAKMRNEP